MVKTMLCDPRLVGFVKASFDGSWRIHHPAKERWIIRMKVMRVCKEVSERRSLLEGRESKPTTGGRTASCPGLSREGGIPSEMQFLFWNKHVLFMCKPVNSNFGWETSLPVYVLLLPRLSATRAMWLGRTRTQYPVRPQDDRRKWNNRLKGPNWPMQLTPHFLLATCGWTR